jgi:multisubunit Na+/H+ antiporter MnhE subunit
MKYFNEIFQLSVLISLIAYVFIVGEPSNVNLIIGALIGVLTGQISDRIKDKIE